MRVKVLRRTFYLLLIIGVVGICGIFSINFLGDRSPLVTQLQVRSDLRMETDPIISITCNADIAAYASQGDGSAAHPYIIENKVIDGGGVNDCINITHTSAHLILRNCTVYNGIYGIYLYAVNNTQLINNTANHNLYGIFVQKYYFGRISNCTANFNSEIGIEVMEAADILLLSNTIFNSTEGVDLYEAENTSFCQNRIANSTNYGVWLLWSSNCALIGNNISGSRPSAVKAFMSDNLTLFKNAIWKGWGGFDLQSSQSIKVLNNSLIKNLAGISCFWFTNSTISGNIIYNNTEAGISLCGASNFNNITGNFLHENRLGIKVNSRGGSLPPCIGNTIQDNDIRDRVPEVPWKLSLGNETTSGYEKAPVGLHWSYLDGATVFYIYRLTSCTPSPAGQVPIAKVYDDGVSVTLNYLEYITQRGTYYYFIVAGNPWGNSTTVFSWIKYVVHIQKEPSSTAIPGFELPSLMVAVMLILIYAKMKRKVLD